MVGCRRQRPLKLKTRKRTHCREGTDRCQPQPFGGRGNATTQGENIIEEIEKKKKEVKGDNK
jgi:hypothetical protein